MGTRAAVAVERKKHKRKAAERLYKQAREKEFGENPKCGKFHGTCSGSVDLSV